MDSTTPADQSVVCIVGEYPGEAELALGKAWAVPMDNHIHQGGILNMELRRAGIVPGHVAMTHAWLHAPEEKVANERAWHARALFKFLKPYTLILLCGTLAVDMILEGNTAESLSGLWTTSPLLPGKDILIAPALTHLMKGGVVGELRLALSRFQLRIKKGQSHDR